MMGILVQLEMMVILVHKATLARQAMTVPQEQPAMTVILVRKASKVIQVQQEMTVL